MADDAHDDTLATQLRRLVALVAPLAETVNQQQEWPGATEDEAAQWFADEVARR